MILLILLSHLAFALTDVVNLGADPLGKKDATKFFEKALNQNKQIYVPKGRFQVSGLKLYGAHILGEGTLFAVAGSPVFIIEKGATRLEGLSFETQSSKARAEIQLTENSEDLIVFNCRFNGKAYSAVSGDINGIDDSSLLFKKPATRIHIINNSFTGYVSPLYFHSIEEVIVRNNFFQDSFYDAIRLRQRVKKVIIESNQFKNIGTSKQIVSRDAIDTYWSGVELIIRSNILENISALGLDIKGIDPDGLYKNSLIIVSDNIIKKTGYSAILVSSAQKPAKGSWSHVGPIVIRGNLIEKAHTINEQINNAAIWFRHGVADGIISGNVIKDSFGHGIGINNFEKKAPINENIVVTQNIINGCSSGLYLHKIKSELIKDNIIENCKKEIQRD
jgi:hypothetical protein